jgi:hypothetical protein
MRVSVLHSIINSVDAIVPDEATRQALKMMIRQTGQAHGYSMADRGERVIYARRLLDLQVSRPTIRDRLIGAFGISRTEAYRAIDQALKLSQSCPGFGTLEWSTSIIENYSVMPNEREDRS